MAISEKYDLCHAPINRGFFVYSMTPNFSSMKNLTLFLLLLCSFSVMAQYHEHKPALESLQKPINKTYRSEIKMPYTLTNSVTLMRSPTLLTAGNTMNSGHAEHWTNTTMTGYSGNHRFQTSQSFDMRGNLTDSRASFNFSSKKRK
jgi:hypothetical protein